jgi:hypothetical protein
MARNFRAFGGACDRCATISGRNGRLARCVASANQQIKPKGAVMSDFHNHSSWQRLQHAWRRHEESSTMLALLMAGIATIFILGIVAAFNYAAHTNSAENEQPAATASAPASAAPATTGSTRPPATTTGSGSANRSGGAMPRGEQGHNPIGDDFPQPKRP